MSTNAASPSPPPVLIRPFEALPYAEAHARMRAFTAQRGADTVDEIWLVQHPPVFTLGLAGKPEHLLAPGDIPIVKTERGGQVTYHGPGQAIAYLMLDLTRRGLSVRCLVQLIEDSVIELLDGHAVAATRRDGAPGVYLRQSDGSAGAKIAALGIKVSRGCTYHGVALNVAMDLEPFTRINPCGYPGLQVTDLARQLSRRDARGDACSDARAGQPAPDVARVADALGGILSRRLTERALSDLRRRQDLELRRGAAACEPPARPSTEESLS